MAKIWLKLQLFGQKRDHLIVLWKKTTFLRRKLVKIAENIDHNIEPRA
jgi:hypothetical protein